MLKKQPDSHTLCYSFQDEIPELNEVFLVNLTSVQLLDPPNSETPPRLGKVVFICVLFIC